MVTVRVTRSMKPDRRTAINAETGKYEPCHCYDFCKKVRPGYFVILHDTPNLKKGQLVNEDVIEREMQTIQMIS